MYRILTALLLIAAAITSLQSCRDYDSESDNLQGIIDGREPITAVVTYMPSADGSYRFILDSSTSIRPFNGQGLLYDKEERRCIIEYFPIEKSVTGSDTTVVAKILSARSIKPGRVAIYDPDADYGDDPVTVVTGWPTLVADGYLTVYIEAGNSRPNLSGVTLTVGADPDHPNEATLHYDALASPPTEDINPIVAFDLNDIGALKDERSLILRWRSQQGEKADTLRLRLR